MASTTSNLLPLATAEYKTIYDEFISRYHGRGAANNYISECLSQVSPTTQNGLRVLIIGPGVGEIELKLLAPHKIDHLTAVEPNIEMAAVLETNLLASSSFIKDWNIERTGIETYLMNKKHDDGPFDIILMIHSMYYVASRDDVLRQVRSLLRPRIGIYVVVIAIGCIDTISRKYRPESKHVYDSDDFENELRDIGIPFERHPTQITLDLTGIKGDDKLQRIIASFFLAANVAHADNNLVSQVVQEAIDMANATEDGKLGVNIQDDVFIIRATD